MMPDQSKWLEDFNETCQDMIEDAFLLNALALYISNHEELTSGEWAAYFPPVLHRLCDYLSQHAAELHRLKKQLRADPRTDEK